MELRVSSRRPRMSYESDPDEKEISDDDDDRNHKHRRRDDARSRLLNDEVTEHVYAKPYRRGSKPFQNGHLYGATGSQSNETWKKYSFNPLGKEISVKFNQKGPVNQKSRATLPFSGNPGAVRGRGMNSSQWNPSEPGFSSVDIASQTVPQGSTHHSIFAGRGLATVSNSQGQSWNPFGLAPGIPNGGLDMFHPLDLQGTYKPAINSSLNMGLARRRCRDFEEQGFCLRGDMCPMEHGKNRIVVEDVQSLSQFNLPISLASENLAIASVGAGPTPATSVVTNMLLNSKGSNAKNIKHGIGDIDSAADFYDPDQPLWSNDSHISTGLQSISQPSVGKNDSLLDHDLSGDHLVGQSDGSDNELVTSSAAIASLKTRSSVQGRITSIRKRTEMGENVISKTSPSNFLHNETTSNGIQDTPHHKKLNNSHSSLKVQSGNEHINRKPSQKAQRTLFVNGIPHQNNKRELLLSHFKKFGEVTEIFIPLNSERAFVQFSKREEAEAALMAPDAVMSNRFIKLWWANRDIIHDIQTVSGHNMSIPSHGLKVSSAANKRKDDFQSELHNNKGSQAPVSASDHLKPMVVDGTEVTPPLRKKLKNLELLKEELRKKQETLDQKRSDFWRMLDKLEKQATVPKGEVSPQQLAKKLKSGGLADPVKAATPCDGDRDAIVSSAQDEVTCTSITSVGPSGKQSSKSNLALPESSNLKSSSFSLVNLGSPVFNNRFKLDNRPTAFKIAPPLPDGLADVPTLKEHFSPYGDLLKVQVDDLDSKTSKISAHIYFRTRHAAEKAFLGGNSWKGHNLQFVWLNSINSKKDDVAKHTRPPFSKDSPKTISQQVYTSGNGDSEITEGTKIAKDDSEPYETHQSNSDIV